MSRLQSIDPPALSPRPSDRLVEVGLRDGATAFLRPLERGEVDPLLAVFDGMSSESRALRYLTGLARIPGPMLRMLTDVDGDRHVSWLASIAGEPVGVARSIRVPGAPTSAEIAFEVVDRHQGRGLGAVLLDTVTTVAAARGVRRLQASLAPSNAASRRLLARIGLGTRLVDGLLEAEGPFRLLDPRAVDRAAVIRVACTGTSPIALDIG